MGSQAQNWHIVWARGHHGYPQPEDGYCDAVYDQWCPRCGRHGAQVSPFRVRSAHKAQHSHFLQLNWVFDAFFVLPDVGEQIVAAGITGVALGPVLDHKTGKEAAERRQLLIGTVHPCLDTTRLAIVTCRPENEEWTTESLGGGDKRYTVDTPYCGGVKHHSPTVAAFQSPLQTGLPDLFQSEEWFGSGGSSFRLTLASERFVELVRTRKWRGLSFNRVLTSGHSERLDQPSPQ